MPFEETVRIPTGVGIRTTYRIKRSQDFDYPLGDFMRFWRRHPELDIDEEAVVVIEDLCRRRRAMADLERLVANA